SPSLSRLNDSERSTMDLPTDELKGLIAELRETNHQWRDLIAARIENERQKSEMTVEYRNRTREEHEQRAASAKLSQQQAAEQAAARKAEHEATIRSQEAYRASLVDKPPEPNRINALFVLLLLWSAFVSTILLVWLVFK